MLINRKQEGEGGREVNGEVSQGEPEGYSHEYRTANELYEILAKNHPFDPDDEKSLTAQDLVILYKNIDIGTKLLTNSNNDFKRKSNQYVECVVHNDQESEGSDVSEVYSNEDFNNVFTVNSERIDFFNNMPTYDNTLCEKFGYIDMKSSKLTSDYDKHFLFNDPYIKEQLKGFHAISKSKHSDSSVLPTSLLDYICSKRLEDNYNFYMDNVIQYVKHTIDQLKRISNGDYLTERVKKKWKEVCVGSNNDFKKSVQKSTNSIKLQAEDKFNEVTSMWDDTAHSEMDVRSLSKILEKRIVVEVPKLLSGSFKLFSKCYKNRLFIRCQKDRQISCEDERPDSQLDVVLKLKRSASGHVISNIDSIMILKTLPAPISEPESPKKILAALQKDDVKDIDERIKIIELNGGEDIAEKNMFITNPVTEGVNYEDWNFSDEGGDNCNKTNMAYGNERTEANFNLVTPNELRYTMHRLNTQLPVLEEVEDMSSKRKKSPTKVRIKSPYENKLFLMEERKRKKLLEIREKREKKKIAMNENCKVTKHRYGKGAIMPQPSSSVTKLSITNKSFYNSIYGQTLNADSKTLKRCKGLKGDNCPTLDLHSGEEDFKRSTSFLTPERNSQKYINRSYYLDEAETEVMYVQMKTKSISEEARETSTDSTSPLSTDTPDNLVLFQQLMNQSATEFSVTDTLPSLHPNFIMGEGLLNTNCKEDNQSTISTVSTNFIVPTNTPKIENDYNDEEDIPPTLQCRKSIEKVYNLIKELSKADSCEMKGSKSKTNFDKVNVGVKVSSTFQASDSGTSVKHQLTSSNPSSFSFDKPNFDKTNPEVHKITVKKYGQPASVVPKVIISSKISGKQETEKMRKEFKKSQSEEPKNPLKAISQLLHEFDHVQKTRTKSGHETKSNRKSESTSEGRVGSRQTMRKILHQEQHLKMNGPVLTKLLIPYEKKARSSPGKESLKTANHHISIEERCADRGNKKKLSDFIDEVKELNGEAVRGPPKRTSRLNSLAQPKKSYVQAHHEEYQSRYGRNVVSDRLHKLATAPCQDRNTPSTNYKNRQRRGSEVTTGATKHSTGPCLGAKARRSASSSPDGKRSPVLAAPSYNYSNVPETPQPLKKKMVAVETYVKSHFGHVTPAREQIEEQVRKSRVPLLPTDFDIASLASSPGVVESTTLGNKLHSIIDTMFPNLPALAAVAECNESGSKLEKDEIDDISIGISSKCDEIISCSDYPVDVFEDKNIVTAVESIFNNKNDETARDECDDNEENFDKDGYSSKTEMQMLENALYDQLSSGSFQKRLRNKNLTLTPKQSLQQVVFLQSGDSRSMVKSTLSQKNEMSKTDTFSELAMLPGLSKSCIGWEFSEFPFKIATVGYAFTKIQPVKCTSTPRFKTAINNVKNIETKRSETISKCCKSLQCSKENTIYRIESSQSIVKNSAPYKKHIDKGNNCIEKNITKILPDKEAVEEINKSQMNEIVTENENAEKVEHSNSLDILVGLLNEIKKITTCQANMVSFENNLDIDLESKELEIILNKAAEQENSAGSEVTNIISRTTLDNLQHLRLKPSNYSIVSCHQSNVLKIDKQIITSHTNLPFLNNTLTVDKEINVNIFEKRWRNRCTEVCQLFPITVSQSTNVTDSLIKIINKSSSPSVDIFEDCITLQTSCVKNLKQPSSSVFTTKSKYSMTSSTQCEADCKKENNNCKMAELVYKKSNKQFDKLRKILPKESEMTIAELDPLIKMKRDILVTVYSILVFTMFAALSFPQFAY